LFAYWAAASRKAVYVAVLEHSIFHRVDSKNATLVNNSPIFTERPENQFARLWSLLIEDYQSVDKYASA
jgi:hypothetical protein